MRDVIDEVMAAANGVILPDIEPVDDDGLIRFNAATVEKTLPMIQWLGGVTEFRRAPASIQ